MLFDFAVTCREDEELLTAEVNTRRVQTRVFAFTGALDAEYRRAAGHAAQYRQ